MIERQRIELYPGADSVITKLRKLGVRDREDFIFTVDRFYHDTGYQRSYQENDLKTRGKRRKA